MEENDDGEVMVSGKAEIVCAWMKGIQHSHLLVEESPGGRQTERRPVPPWRCGDVARTGDVSSKRKSESAHVDTNSRGRVVNTQEMSEDSGSKVASLRAVLCHVDEGLEKVEELAGGD